MPASAADDDDYDGRHDQGLTPEKVKRHVTDGGCCVVFFLCIGVLVYVYSYALTHGAPEKYAGLPTAKGDICGVTDAVKSKPFLFFCKDSFGKLSYSESRCVADCDQSGCPFLDYVAEPFADMVCLPNQETAKALAKESMELVTHNPEVARLLKVGALIKAWPLLVGSGAVAMVAGFLFLFFLELASGCIIWSGFIIVIGGCLAFGAAMLHSSQQPGGLDGLPGTGDSQQDLAIGATAVALGLLILCLACCKKRSMDRAIKCVTAAAECIKDTPSILAEPFLALIIKVVTLVGLLVGWAYLLSTAKSVTTSVTNGIEVEYTTEEKIYIGFLFFMSLWLFEFSNALSTYVIAYVTQLWWFKVGGPCSVLKAYVSGLVYHTGSLAMGSFIIALVRGIRIVVMAMSEASKESANPVGEIATRCCSCCLGCFEQLLQKLNKFAYMDIAINSNSFCMAAGHALSVLTNNATSAFLLHGATFLIEFAGLGSITVAGGLATYFATTNIPRYCNSSSADYVEDPVFVAIAAGVVSFFVALPFVIVFSAVADTVLFCYALEVRRTPAHDERSSFLGFDLLGCFKSSVPTVRRPNYDDSRHPPKTRSLLGHVAPNSDL